MFPYITLATQTSTCHDTSVYMYQLSELSPVTLSMELPTFKDCI